MVLPSFAGEALTIELANAELRRWLAETAMNLETQGNGSKTGVDPHTPIKPETVRRGDYD